MLMVVGAFAALIFLICLVGDDASQKMPFVVGLIISGLGTMSGYGLSRVASNLSYKQAMLERPRPPRGLFGEPNKRVPPIEQLGARRGPGPRS